MSEEQQAHSREVPEGRRKIIAILKSALTVMKYSTLLRVAIALLINKFNLQKVLKGLGANIRFGLAVTLLSFI